MKLAATIVATALVTVAGGGCAAPQNGINVRVDLDHGRYPISQFIYGVNTYPGYTPLSDATAWRLGGNRYSTYNWENNSSNSGTDNHPATSGDWLIDKPEFRDVPAGVVQQYMGRGPDFSHNSALVVTVPMLGWVAADKNGDTTDADKAPGPRWKKMLARKPGAPGSLRSTPDLNDDAVYADEYVYALNKIYGAGVWSAPTKRIILELDNEVDYWNQKHPLVHPDPTTYAEINDKSIEWGAAIKEVAPRAIIFSPAGIGPLTMQSLGNAPDAPAKDLQVKNDYLISFLKNAKAAQARYGYRVVDGFSFHWYAFGVNMTFDNRLQNTRSLWDPTYTEDSWVSQVCSIWPPDGKHHPLTLLPIMQQNIADVYPGTKIGITEYDYGGDGDISGAIAESDFLGIMGRQHVYLANHWGDSEKFVRAGIEIYRNYDGAGGTFGDIGLPVDGVPSDRASVYAALDDNTDRLTVVAINRSKQKLPTTLNLSGRHAYHNAKLYQITQATPSVKPAGDLAVDGDKLAYTMPPLSVTMFDVR